MEKKKSTHDWRTNGHARSHMCRCDELVFEHGKFRLVKIFIKHLEKFELGFEHGKFGLLVKILIKHF